ncbi:hypothetical protein KPH14_003665 [Odynerus spinipes]|uniref:RING-type E3 ubiquitin transferase BRCA1 n=1 Tax=Odynerus spinipes TaxID=1348599 RepID=A0AAD9RX33_9HYME|nr:hypothetical protein KPH14_003665 [Odynerus spinipes]
MTEDQFLCIDNLSEAVKAIQSCLQCTICLDMISSPVKTRCGHSFCRTCIGTVLNKKNSKCPLCNTNLQRRSISKDKHTERCINGFEQLVEAIRADINIDILSHLKNPRNTREGCPTPNVRRQSAPSANDTGEKKKDRKTSPFRKKKIAGEQSAGSSNRDILDETSATCTEYKKDNAIKKDDSVERRNEGRESSIDGLSGVYPLFSSLRREEDLNEEMIYTKEKRIENWLETLPNSELLENPSTSVGQVQASCLDDTATVVSGISLMSSVSNTTEKEETPLTVERLTKLDNVQERPSDSMKGQRVSKASSRGGNNTRGRNKRRTTRSFPEREIKVDSTERKLKYETVHAKVRERAAATEKSVKISADSLISSIDAADSSKHLAGTGNTTKETWKRVVQFGKEMRTKRNKLKSLNVSVQSTSGLRLSDEHASNKTLMNMKVSSTNLQTRSGTVEDDGVDLIEDGNDIGRLEDDREIDQHRSLEEKNDPTTTRESSFISLEQEGRVPINSLCREQMDDIIGVTYSLSKNTDHQECKEKISEDQGTVPKKRLSLRKHSESSKNSDRSPLQITPVKVNLEQRYDILRASSPLLSSKDEEHTPMKVCGTALQTESTSKLSLKKNSQSGEKANQVPTWRDVSQLSSVKCNLMEQMNRTEIERNVGNVETLKIDRGSELNEKKVDRERTNQVTPSNNRKTFVVPFSKLGKVFRKRRKVKFYKLGPLRRESATSTLSASISNASRVNVTTFVVSEDTIETCEASEECNLENSAPKWMEVVDTENGQTEAAKNLSQSQDDERPSRNTVAQIQQRNKLDFGESSKEAENVSTNQKERKIFERNRTGSKPVITSIVKMIPPQMDSQLKFLHLDSPWDTIPEREMIYQKTKSKRTSEQKLSANSSERSDIVSNDDSRKRKRLYENEENFITDSVKRITKNDIAELSDQNESDHSRSSGNVTQVARSNESVDKLVKTRRTVDGAVISLSSNESTAESGKLSRDTLNESRKKYKRIIAPASGSDTDTSVATRKNIDVRERNDDENVSIAKRKRVPSADSDDDIVVNEIVSNWCNGLDTSQRSSKKGKLEETKAARASSSRSIDPPPDSMNFESWNNFATPVKRVPEKEEEDRSNNDIIDKVRSIRMNEDERKSGKERDTIDDHFDEAMAEVMTETLDTHFFINENVVTDPKPSKKVGSPIKTDKNRVSPTSSYVETNDLFAETNRSKAEENSKDFEETLIENLSGLNKENSGKVGTPSSEVELTNERRRIDQPFQNKETSISNARKYEKSKNENIVEPKEASYEYDSLMDVTQDQLLLKALEEDLFGAANSRSLGKSTATKTSEEKRRLQGESRTPRKVQKMNLGNEDAENSSDEDEIIENTPQSQKKFMDVDHSAESRARKSLNMSQATQVSRQNFKATTTSTTTAPTNALLVKLKTPIDQNKIRPLYHSTPKIIQAASNREKVPSSKFEENGKALESSSSHAKEESVTQVKGKTTENANRSCDKRQLCFVWSSLAVTQIESIKKLAALIGASCTQDFTPLVTHVIVGTKEENNAATKTLKFLQGIAHKKFVVGFKWVADCLKEGRLLNEEPYEAVDCYTFEAGPRKSRLRESDLFEKFAFLCIEPFRNITMTQWQELLKAMGATIVRNIAALVASKEKYKVILLQNEAHEDEVVADWYKKSSAIPVSCDWIVECISQYKLVSCYVYLHEVVPEDALKLGYPDEMIVPEDFDSTCDTSTGH